MKIAIIPLGLIAFCISCSPKYSKIEGPISDYRYFPGIDNTSHCYENLVSNIQDTFDIEAGQVIGSIAPYPVPKSERFQTELDSSEYYYKIANYYSAARVLQDCYYAEKENPFIADAYARALFKCSNAHRDTSFIVYEKLVEQLDEQSDCDKGSIIINAWFKEAYWKYAALLLDRKEWEKAISEMNRALIGGSGNISKALAEQAYEYFGEAYYELNMYKESIYYSTLVLQLNPNNTFASKILQKSIAGNNGK